MQLAAAGLSILVSIGVLSSTVRKAITRMWRHSLGKTSWLLENHIREEEAALARIEAELRPNGGESLRDAINDIANKQHEQDAFGRALLHTSNLATLRTDAHGKLTHINRAYQYLTGWSLDEVKGDGWVNAISPEDRDRIKHRWQEAVASKREFHDDIIFVRPDGAKFEAHANVYREMDSQGKVRGWLGVIIPTKKYD